MYVLLRNSWKPCGSVWASQSAMRRAPRAACSAPVRPLLAKMASGHRRPAMSWQPWKSRLWFSLPKHMASVPGSSLQ